MFRSRSTPANPRQPQPGAQTDAPGVWPLRQMKIAHITANFPPHHSSAGTVCYQNALMLTQMGHEVHVFTAAEADAPAEETMHGVLVHRLRPLVRAAHTAVLPGLLWRLHGFDVLHLHYPFLGGEVVALAARLTRTPLIISYHQDVSLTGVLGVVEKVLRHTVERMTLRAASRLLFSSLEYSMASRIRPLLQGRERIIDELPNGVDVATFHPGTPEESLRAKYYFAPDDQVVLMVAELDHAHSFKGVAVFLDALTRLPPHVKGLIIGEGDLRQSYQVMARVLGIGSRVHFPGQVVLTDLPRYYRMAAATVLPATTTGEAFGSVLVESLASGTPAITTDLPGLRTVVDHGSDGLLVPPGNPAALAGAIGRLTRYATMREVMGMRGRAKVTGRYHWPLIGRRLEILYSQMLDEAAARPVFHLHRHPELVPIGGDRPGKDG